MGRHSAPDDEQDGVVATAVARTSVDVAPRRGRHSLPEDEDDSGAAQPLAEQITERVPPPAESVARGNQSTAEDVELLRTHSDVRARVIAAVVAPFVLYTVALYLVGGFDVYLLWVWIPLVTAGV